MFIDASAICAIILKEAEASSIVRRIELTDRRLSSPTAIWESVIATRRATLAPVTAAHAFVLRLCEDMGIEIVAIPPAATLLAIDAYDRFGKGRHPAALNFGDCFSYACARHYRVPLLYKGDDFARTDIEAA